MTVMEEDDEQEECALPLSDYRREYKVLRQIANGAFGSVHCVQRRDTKVIHAAKYVKSRRSDLAREVRALRALGCGGSRFILRFVALYRDEPSGVQAVLVTEFLAGGDLCERTSDRDYSLTEKKCRDIMRQICRGVRFIHRNRFVHLDLKPFNIVFAQKKDDFDLRIIDFGLARELDESASSVRVGMCGTIEYMSPEVMNCTVATAASDCWGIGVIAYQLLSGGISPFFAVNRFRTMARVLDCDYSLDQPEFAKTSDDAKDFISRLLVKEPRLRMSIDECLQHPWLLSDKVFLNIVETLETTYMRRCLARRRWYRLLNAVRVIMTTTNNMRPSSSTTSTASVTGATEALPESTADHSSSEEDATGGFSARRLHTPPDGLSVRDIASYHETYHKLSLILNNGSMGTFFTVEHRMTGEVFTSKHLRGAHKIMAREAAVMHRLRNDPNVVAFLGLYEGPNHSVIVTDHLAGGDLVERTASADFELNEIKCKSYVRQLCAGLRHVHECGVLHLDLKPFSVIFERPDGDHVKITDFALAQFLPPDGLPLKLQQMCGSLEFLSPEMLECTYASKATDCWGVGVIAFMLVTGGRSPFYGGNRFRTMARILAGQYETLHSAAPHISTEAKDFIARLLYVDPLSRMTATECLDHKWLTRASDSSAELLQTLETSWMKQLLARRRWQRWYNAVRATQRIRKLSTRACEN